MLLHEQEPWASQIDVGSTTGYDEGLDNHWRVSVGASFWPIEIPARTDPEGIGGHLASDAHLAKSVEVYTAACACA